MIYGCIGEHLPHSFSAEIHRQIGPEPYELREIAPEALNAFLAERDFEGINVTIPYKQAVIPALAGMSDTARAIGAVNTVVRRRGLLYGDNTDAEGLTRLIRRTGIDPAGGKALILGTGGTSRTALHVLRALGASEVLRVSRTAREGAVSYEAARTEHADAAVIVNTTPCGMYPRAEETPISLEPFGRLRGVVDAIYNPLRSRLVLAAQARGIPAAGGLYMLVAQAVRAAEIFRDTRYPDSLTEEIFGRLRRSKENIVLIGMPGCGKSAVAAALRKALGRESVDTDALIVARAGKPIPEIFREDGEKHFRDLETAVIRELAPKTGLIVATGGGAVLRPENVEALKQNGRLLLLDRPLQELLPTDDRPLADTREKILSLYEARMPIYRAAADEVLPVRGTPEEMAEKIIR